MRICDIRRVLIQEKGEDEYAYLENKKKKDL